MAGRDETEFARAFERGEIRHEVFHHPEHLRVAWVYLAECSNLTEAEARMRESLRSFAARAGHSGKYHDTLTIFWVRLLASARGAFQNPPIQLAEVLSAHPYLLDKNAPLAYYSRQRLFSNEARATWIAPDLKALSGDRTAADPGNTSSDAPHRTVSRATPALRPVAG